GSTPPSCTNKHQNFSACCDPGKQARGHTVIAALDAGLQRLVKISIPAVSMKHQDKISGKQMAAGRVLAGISRAKLAQHSGVSEADLKLMEANDGAPGGPENAVMAVRDAL